MKLLLDQNLSHRLVAALSEIYPGSAQVSLLGMGDAPDKTIWEYAREHGYAIVTLDADFHEYSLLWSGPPQLIPKLETTGIYTQVSIKQLQDVHTMSHPAKVDIPNQ